MTLDEAFKDFPASFVINERERDRDPYGGGATMKFVCAAEDLDTVYLALYLTADPIWTNLICTKVKEKWLCKGQPNGLYQCTATYGPWIFGQALVMDGPLQWGGDVGSMDQFLCSSVWTWQSDGKRLNQSPIVPVSCDDLIGTGRKTNISSTTWDAWRDTVNNAQLTLGPATYAAGCVLFMGASWKPRNVEGMTCYDVAAHVRVRSVPWTKQMRSDTQTWDTPLNKNGQPMVASSDMSDLGR